MAPPPADHPSFLLVEEYFDHEDERFVAALRHSHPPAQLAAFADRWKKDPRPWARRQILAYLELPLEVPNQHPVVKRLFKHAEQSSDHELLGVFLHVFDCLVRRVRKSRHHWIYDPQVRTGRVEEEEVLAVPKNCIVAGGQIVVPRRGRPAGRLFSYATRRYLRRRAWRFFRWLAHRQPTAYCAAIAVAIARFTDDDLRHGEDLLESWGLMNACFRGHEALEFPAQGVRLREGRKLSELSAAPYRGQLWQEPAAFTVLLDLLTKARSRCVRTWARQLIERDHAPRLAELSADQLLALLNHADEEVQQFGASLLASLSAAANWPVTTWLRLLETKDATAVAKVCEVMQRHVRGERLDLAQCLALATARATPVARLGLSFLQQRKIAAADRPQLATLASARCGAIGGELARWVLSLVGTRETYDREVVLALHDSLLAELRSAAWGWLRAAPPIPDDPVLWCRLLETPFDDLRLALIDHLQAKSALPGLHTKDLTPIWSAVLAGIHRGGRQKLKAIEQIADAICRRPEEAGDLLPVLSIAVRSIRQPESRAALAAIARVAAGRPELEPLIAAQLPELTMTSAITQQQP